MSKPFRLLVMALKTVTGFKRQGYFIPYRYAHITPTPGTLAPYAPIEGLFQEAQGTFEAGLELFRRYDEDLLKIGADAPPEPRWRQSWFPRMDGAAAYALTREHRPARIIEVGSGHSTRFFYRAIRDEGLDCALTAIDPAPRADIAALPLTLHLKTVQAVDESVFADLKAGDFLMVDSSHIAMPGTDVDVLFNRILPRLPSGVFVHIHDIFLPDDYPASWTWRGYNEHQAVAPLLTSGGFEVIWSSWYVFSRMKDAWRNTVIAELEMPDEAMETSLWLRKK